MTATHFPPTAPRRRIAETPLVGMLRRARDIRVTAAVIVFGIIVDMQQRQMAVADASRDAGLVARLDELPVQLAVLSGSDLGQCFGADQQDAARGVVGREDGLACAEGEILTALGAGKFDQIFKPRLLRWRLRPPRP